MKNLLYTIKANTPKEEIISQLREHPEIKFVSPVGIDLAGNDTDEKIPVRLFIKDIGEFYAGRAVQTNGSSVVLLDDFRQSSRRYGLQVEMGHNEVGGLIGLAGNGEHAHIGLAAVTAGGALRTQIIKSFKAGAILRWKTEMTPLTC